MGRKDKYNSSGYLDMTAYLVIRNVEREAHRLKMRKDKKMKDKQQISEANGKHKYKLGAKSTE